MTAQQYKKWKAKKVNQIRLNRLGYVLGILFLIAYWVPAPKVKLAEAQNTITVQNTGFGAVEQTATPTPMPTHTPTPSPKPTKAPKTDQQKIKEYLTAYGSPMAGYAGTYVKYGKKHGIDPKIMVAISVTESSAGKNLCHGETYGHNAWGILYRKRLANNSIVRSCIEFGSYDAGIEYLAKLLGGSTYKGAGKTTIKQIGTKYDPNNPAWVKSTQRVYNLINNK